MTLEEQMEWEALEEQNKNLKASILAERAETAKYFRLYGQVCTTAQERLKEIVRVEGQLALLKGKLNLLQPELYTHELLSNGGEVHLGVAEKGICEQAHCPGETSEEIKEWISVETLRNLVK